MSDEESVDVQSLLSGSTAQPYTAPNTNQTYTAPNTVTGGMTLTTGGTLALGSIPITLGTTTGNGLYNSSSGQSIHTGGSSVLFTQPTQQGSGFMEVEERMVLKTSNGDIVVHPDGSVDLPENFPDAYRLMWEALASRFQRTVRNHVRSEAKKLIDTLREDLSMHDVKAYDAVTKVLDAFGNKQP